MEINDNINILRENIEKKKLRLGINYNIEIVAVTKTRSVSEINEALSCGITNIGENRVLEAEKKFIELGLEGADFTKHMIGHLQSNKIKKALEIFDMIQSVDSLLLAEKMNKRLTLMNKTMPILIEVNASGESSKWGVSTQRVEELIEGAQKYKNLMIRGFMTIAPFTDVEKDIRASFKSLYETKIKAQNMYRQLDLSILSMGMSSDYEIAIEEGSTMIRPGTIIFGDRG